MNARTLVRRSTFSIVVIGLALSAATGCSNSPNPVAPSPGTGTQAGPEGNPGLSPQVAASTGTRGQAALEGEPRLGPQLAAVRGATAQFHDVNTAIAAGYLNPGGRICDQIAIGTMGIHTPKPALLASQTVDPLQPEVLLYLPKPGGGFRLIGVEYIQYVLLRDPATNQIAPWTSPTPWPSHYEVVTPTPELFGQTFAGPMPGHLPGMPWHWDLHVWIWANNPSGMFEQWNPALSCS